MDNKKTALYVRVSTDHQANGLDSQIKALKHYCEIRGILDYEVYQDFGISGGTQNRPALIEMNKQCESGLIDSVLTYSFSRYARSSMELSLALEKYDSLGIKFISISENLDTGTPLGRTIFQIIASISELERSIIRERVINGLKAAKARGKQIGAKRKFVNADAFIKLSETGMSTRAIAKAMSCSQGTVVNILNRRE